jgi:predicted ABC-type ATPase
MRTLTIVAGTNGAGKSYIFSGFLKAINLLNETVEVVIIDELEKYINETKIPFDFLRYEKERRKEIDRIFTELCQDAINYNRDFAYECNLREDQLKNVQLFENAGYQLNLIFIWLDNTEISTRRVQRRVAEGGHSVGEDDIVRNYKEGLHNLDTNYQFFNEVYVFDNSVDVRDTPSGEEFTLLLHIQKGKIKHGVPQFLTREDIATKLPNISKAFQNWEVCPDRRNCRNREIMCVNC